MDLFEAIKGRRSVREFFPDEVSQEDLERILDMARYAPTAGNAQPWKFLLVKDKENKARLKQAVEMLLREKIEGMALAQEEEAERKEGFCQFVEEIFVAPVLIFVFVDESQYLDLVVYDGALAVQNMMLTAHALGYGTSFQTTIFPEELVKDYFFVPDHYKFICAVPIGRPVARPEVPKRKQLASFIWEERFPG